MPPQTKDRPQPFVRASLYPEKISDRDQEDQARPISSQQNSGDLSEARTEAVQTSGSTLVPGDDSAQIHSATPKSASIPSPHQDATGSPKTSAPVHQSQRADDRISTEKFPEMQRYLRFSQPGASEPARRSSYDMEVPVVAADCATPSHTIEPQVLASPLAVPCKPVPSPAARSNRTTSLVAKQEDMFKGATLAAIPLPSGQWTPKDNPVTAELDDVAPPVVTPEHLDDSSEALEEHREVKGAATPQLENPEEREGSGSLGAPLWKQAEGYTPLPLSKPHLGGNGFLEENLLHAARDAALAIAQRAGASQMTPEDAGMPFSQSVSPKEGFGLRGTNAEAIENLVVESLRSPEQDSKMQDPSSLCRGETLSGMIIPDSEEEEA